MSTEVESPTPAPEFSNHSPEPGAQGKARPEPRAGRERPRINMNVWSDGVKGKYRKPDKVI